MVKSELEERLIDFSVAIIEISGLTKNNYAGNHLTSQIIRSATSTALNYGEAQSAESRKDFVHKMQIVLKELRETSVCLRIIKKSKLCQSIENVETLIKENNELISIFVKSVETAKKNSNKE